MLSRHSHKYAFPLRLEVLILALLLLASCRGPSAPEVATQPPAAETQPSSGETQPQAGETKPSDAETKPPATPRTFSVSIGDNTFDPAALAIPVGSTVVWTHNGSRRHTVTADDGSFDSGELTGGATFQHVFEQLGVFAYHCEFHGESGGGGMAGVITVEAGVPQKAASPTAAVAQPTDIPTAAPTAAGPVFTLLVSQGNRDVTQATQRPGLAFGSTTGDPGNLWITWAENFTGGARQIFASELVSGALQPRGASLNIHLNVVGDAPTITFTGENRAVPWVAWSEPSPGFGDVAQIFASRFNAASGLWLPAGQDRGGGETSINLHTNRTASNAFIFGGSGDPTQPTVPWIAWEELSSLSNFEQIFVAKGVKDEAALGSFRWEMVGQLNEISEPSLNVDRFRRALRPSGAFAESGNTVPWVTWHESGANRPDRIFTARGVADPNTPGGFNWIFVPACEPDEVACSLNINPLKDARNASMAAGSVLPGESTVPWIAWEEVGPTGKLQVFVSRLDPQGRNSFLQVGGSLNVDQNQDAIGPIIVFVGNVPYVAWQEDDGSGVFHLQVRHLASDPQTGTWALDSPSQGFNSTSGTSVTQIAAVGAPEGLFLAWIEGDPATEAAQLLAGHLQP